MDSLPQRRRANDLRKRLIGDIKPFHTSGYAEAAYGTAIGATSAQPFAQRLETERSRQVVRSYRESQFGASRGVVERRAVQHLSPARSSVKATAPSPQPIKRPPFPGVRGN